MLASGDIAGTFLYRIESTLVSVAAYHIDCLLDSIVPGVDGIERKP